MHIDGMRWFDSYSILHWNCYINMLLVCSVRHGTSGGSQILELLVHDLCISYANRSSDLSV